MRSSGLILLSASSRISFGFDSSPARANSTSDLGSVALNRSVCRVGGRRRSSSSSCSAKPISKSRSASSNTTYSTERRSRFISTARCSRRPGVAITTSGLLVISANCSSIPSPPTMSAQRIASLRASSSERQPRAMSLPTLTICSASSRDGHRITALVPNVVECRPLSLWISGTRYASVLPEPVRAMPTTSCGGCAMIAGIARRWIGVGCVNPRTNRERSSWGCSPAGQQPCLVAPHVPMLWKLPPPLTAPPTDLFCLLFDAFLATSTPALTL